MVNQHTIPITLFLDDNLGLAFSDLADYLSDLAQLFERSSVGLNIEWQISKISMQSPVSVHLESVSEELEDVLPSASLVAQRMSESLNWANDNQRRSLPAYISDYERDLSANFVSDIGQRGIVGARFGFSHLEQEIANVDLGTIDVEHGVIPVHQGPIKLSVGSLEGEVHTVNFKARKFKLTSYLSGENIWCFVSDESVWNINLVEDVQPGLEKSGRRIKVYGDIHRKADGSIERIDAHEILKLPDQNQIPDLSVLVHEGFTGGVDAVTYVRNLRDADCE